MADFVPMSWPRRPLRLAVAAFVAWAALTVIGEFLIGEFLDQGSTWERIAHDGLGAIQTLLLAVVVGGGLLEWWQRREWQRRTQWIAFSLLNQAMRQLANLASKVVDVASPPGSSRLRRSALCCVYLALVRRQRPGD